jgi:hypothetical protein
MIDFKETQKFTQWWVWVLLSSISFVPIYGLYKQIILGEPFGDKPMSDAGLIAFTLVIFATIYLFYIIVLKTEINKYEISFRFFPFVNKKIKWTDVKNAEVVNYGFVGGYGIRFGTKYGTVYNIKGKNGLAIELINGKKLLVGTQKPDELSKVIEEIKYKRERRE